MRTHRAGISTAAVTGPLPSTASGVDKGSKELEVPLGLGAPGKASPRRPVAAVLTGLMKPVVAAALLATTFVGTAQAQGAPLDSLAAPSAQLVAEQIVAKVDARPALAEALERLLARNSGQDRVIDGAGWGNELEGVDPLARAVYDYVNYVNPRGDYSLWGGELRGAYSEGGLGVGYTFRPKHMTGVNVLTFDDLSRGVQALDRALDAGLPEDAGARDLAALHGKGLTDARIHRAAEALLDQIQDLEGAKERRLGQGVAKLTHAELLEGLTPGSDAHTLAQVALGSKGWTQVLGREIRTIDARKVAFGTGKMQDSTHVDDGVTHYVLLLGKRAEQARLLDAVRAEM